MSAPALPPTALTTLVIMLGASAWPNSPGLPPSQAFANAARGFKDYMCDPQGFGLPPENLLDLFDAETNALDQLETLGFFLEQHMQVLSAANHAVRDVLVYFVGHGAFAGPSTDFYLVHRRANERSLRASGLAIEALAEVLREKARHMRRYLFLDCCFAAAAFTAFQGGPDQIALRKAQDAFSVRSRSSGFPKQGTVLLCSSDHKTASQLLADESSTMFSSALLTVLREGDLHRSHPMSLRDVKELMEDQLAASPEKNAPRPTLLSPDQSQGDVADIPFFPNPRAAREMEHKAEEVERVRKMGEEKQRRMKEDEGRRTQRTAAVQQNVPIQKDTGLLPPGLPSQNRPSQIQQLPAPQETRLPLVRLGSRERRGASAHPPSPLAVPAPAPPSQKSTTSVKPRSTPAAGTTSAKKVPRKAFIVLTAFFTGGLIILLIGGVLFAGHVFVSGTNTPAPHTALTASGHSPSPVPPTATKRPRPAPGIVTEFALSCGAYCSADGWITAGPDHNVWFTTDGSPGKIGRITPGGSITLFAIPAANSGPAGITAGRDGNLWFADGGTSKIWRITPSGTFTEFALPSTVHGSPHDMTVGPDGNVWFTVQVAVGDISQVGRITPSGQITLFSVPTAVVAPNGITTGPDGNVWFTVCAAYALYGHCADSRIERITPEGSITQFRLPHPDRGPERITAGPDGALWFAETAINRIGRITPGGSITEFALPSTNGSPVGITAGPDGNLWFTEENVKGVGKIGRITPTGVITEFVLPGVYNEPGYDITLGPDGNLWFTACTVDANGPCSASSIERITS